MSAPHPNLLVEHLGEVIVVTMKPEDFFDQQMISIAKQELLDLVAAERPIKLIVSFKNVERFSSAFLGALVSLREHLRFHHAEAELKLCELRPAHREVFRLVDPQQGLFKLYETVAEAFRAFQAGSAQQSE
jgi:anti-anti-sigma regulatory factor